MMRAVIQNGLEVMQLSLEVTQTALDIFIELQFAENGVIEVSSEVSCRHETSDLSENGEVSHW